ncbi:Uncharacterised protein [Mycobacterium tuberculosis]|nr:Uncharacterised protein [Mycobacterium tuberculosis]
MKSFRALRFRKSTLLPAKSIVRSGLVELKVIAHRFDVQSSAPYDKRQFAALMDPLNQLCASFLKFRCGERLIRIMDIDHMVLDPGPFFGSSFGCADVHPAVYLHRVPGNDFRIVLFGYRKAQLRLADGRRADQHKEPWPLPVRFSQHRITP